MLFSVLYTPTAIRDLNDFDQPLRERILKKIRFFAGQHDPLEFAEPVYERPPATHRFRIGDYRALLSVRITEDYRIIIYRIQHRKDAYR